MKTSDKILRVKRWMRRYWLLLTAGLLCVLLCGLWLVLKLSAFQTVAPIAHISPDDSLQTAGPVSKLEGYRREMEEVHHQQYRQQQAMEKIVAMDFGSILKAGEERVQADSVRPSLPPQEEELQSSELRQKTKKQPRVAVFPPQPQVVQSVDMVEREAAEAVAAPPFYTIRAETDAPPQGKSYYKAAIHGNQPLLPNTPLCFRLLDSLPLGEKVFPRNTLLYGKWEGSSSGRQHINIYQVMGMPLTLRVHDLDYREGLLSVQAEALPPVLAEGREEVVDQLLYTVPYGGWLSGLARAGKKLLSKKGSHKPLQLTDGQLVFLYPDFSHQIPSP